MKREATCIVVGVGMMTFTYATIYPILKEVWVPVPAFFAATSTLVLLHQGISAVNKRVPMSDLASENLLTAFLAGASGLAFASADFSALEGVVATATGVILSGVTVVLIASAAFFAKERGEEVHLLHYCLTSGGVGITGYMGISFLGGVFAICALIPWVYLMGHEHYREQKRKAPVPF